MSSRKPHDPLKGLREIAAPAWWKKAFSVPPRHLRAREWVEQHVLVRVGARPGPFRLASNPMQGPLFDILEHPAIRETAIMKAVQTGLSTLLRAIEAFFAHTDPCFSLLVLPSRTAGRDHVKKYWGPMLKGKDCPVLKPLQRKRASRRRLVGPVRETEEVDRSTYENIVLSNGHDLLLGYSGSVQSLAGHPCKRVKFDEVDKYNDWDGDEAEPIMLGRRRTETFQESGKVDSISTPTTDLGQIYRLFEASDIKLWPFVRCPFCGAPIQLLFDNVEWDLPSAKEMPDHQERAALLRNEPERVYLKCAGCNGKVGDAQRRDLLHSGWFATQDQGWQFHVDGREVGRKPKGTRVGIHFPQMASLMGSSLPTQAARWVESQGSPKALQDCRNNDHGQPFIWDMVKPEKGLLRQKCQPNEDTGWAPGRKGYVPAWGARLLMTVDTQKDKFYWVIRAWGARQRSRLVAYGEVRTFADLEELIYRTYWPNDDPGLPSKRVFLCAIDSGGGIDRANEESTSTEQVYKWCAADPAVRMALKGVKSKNYESMTRLRPHEYMNPKTGRKTNLNLLWVAPLETGDNLAWFQKAKLEVVSADGEVTGAEVDLWELNDGVDNDYLRHHAVMTRKRIKKKGGRTVYVWAPETDGARHDFHDIERYQIGVAHDANLGFMGLPSEAQIRARAAGASRITTPSTEAGGGITMPDGRPFLATRR